MADDYAAAPIQPIVQGMVTFPDGVGGIAVFEGNGALPNVTRGPSAVGWLILTLDGGLPGNAGAVPPVAPPQVPPPVPPFAPDPDVRTQILVLNTIPILINTISVSYTVSPTPGVGVTEIVVYLTNGFAVPEDPAAGFLITVWRGLGGGPVV